LSIRAAQLPLVLLCLGVWILAHPYQGIFHDANLYTLQALARLHPDALAHDVFLRFGSQDRFTLFSPLYAASIALLGVDRAAATLTLLSQAALIAAGWGLARTAMPADRALLGVAILIAIPGNYGPLRVFACLEPFLTPRMAAEACTVVGVALALSGRRFSGTAFLIMAIALHPVMAAAGVVMSFMAFVALPRPRTAGLLSLLAVAGLLAAAYALPAGQWGRLNADWLALVLERSPYLFLSNWSLDDWGRAAVVLTTLLVGAFSSQSPARRLCLCAALTMLAGIALTGLACDVLRLTLVTQMQPWRWQWLATLSAALLLPFILIGNWQRGSAGRTTALLLCAAWIFGVGAFALTACFTVLASLGFARLPPAQLRLLAAGSYVLLALAVIWRIGSNLEFSELYFMDGSLPLWLRRSISFAHDGCAAALLIGAAAWIMSTRHAVAGAWACAALAAAALAVLAPYTWRNWSREEYPPRQMTEFSDWRHIIAPAEEVFWAESPASSWILLNRANYLSSEQTSGLIFGRAAALEFERRANVLARVIPAALFLGWDEAGEHLSLSPQALTEICGLGAFAYLVSGAELGMQPAGQVGRLKLYRCAPQTRAAAAAT
jgi:hypothetical protein